MTRNDLNNKVIMNFSFFFMIILIDCSSGVSTDTILPDSDLVNENLKGPVNKIFIDYSNIEVVDGIEVLTKGIPDNYALGVDGWGTSIWEYNRYGNLISKTEDLSIEGDNHTTSCYYFYNELQQKIRVIYSSNSRGFSNEKIYRYDYDKIGRLIKESWNEDGEKIVYSYEGNKQIGIEWQALYPTGKVVLMLKSKKTQVVDSLSGINYATKYYYIPMQGSSDFYFERADSIVREFDQYHRVISHISYDTSNVQDFKCLYKYNEHGDEIWNLRMHVFDDLTEETVLTFSYEYDEMNNWIKRTAYENSVPVHVTIRTIEYYD